MAIVRGQMYRSDPLVPEAGCCEQLGASKLQQMLDRGGVAGGGGVVEGVVALGVGQGGRGLVAQQVVDTPALHVQGADQVETRGSLVILTVHIRS